MGRSFSKQESLPHPRKFVRLLLLVKLLLFKKTDAFFIDLFNLSRLIYSRIPSEVLVASAQRSNRKVTFDNALARRGSSFCYKARLNFQAFSLRDLKWRQEKAVAKVKRRAIAFVFAN